MIKVKEVIIVEGRYDKIKLSSLIDGLIIETNGFGIFKDKEKMELIRRLAPERGILILTDSDSAGFKIRSYIGGSIPKKFVKHAYIPDVFGKEKRKTEYSKEGKIGVEGIEKDTILKALKAAGVTADEVPERNRLITKLDLYEDGFTGGQNSSERRLKLLKVLNLPERLSTNALIDILNCIIDYKDYQKIVQNL